MERMRRTGTGRWITATVLLAVLAAGSATAGEDPGFLRTEREVTGGSLSGSWRNLDLGGRAFEQIGGDGLDQQPKGGGGGLATQPGTVGDDGPSVSGEKIKAGALSLILPGAGQFYNGERKKAYIMAGIEAGIWITYFVFDAQGDNAMESSREYSGIYAGTGGDHPDSYWQAVGRYMDSDEYEDYLRAKPAPRAAPAAAAGAAGRLAVGQRGPQVQLPEPACRRQQRLRPPRLHDPVRGGQPRRVRRRRGARRRQGRRQAGDRDPGHEPGPGHAAVLERPGRPLRRRRSF